MLIQNMACAGCLLVTMLIVSGCASSSDSRESQELLMRPSLSVSQEEVARIRAQDQKKFEDLDAIGKAAARVQAFDAVVAESNKKKMARVSAYQKEQMAKRQAYMDQQIAFRRARIAAEQQNLQPGYEAMLEEERRIKAEADAVKLRRGLK